MGVKQADYHGLTADELWRIVCDREDAKRWLDGLADDELSGLRDGLSLYAGGILRKIGQMSRAQLRNQPVALGLLRAYANQQGA